MLSRLPTASHWRLNYRESLKPSPDSEWLREAGACPKSKPCSVYCLRDLGQLLIHVQQQCSMQTSADVWILNSSFPLQVLKIAYTVQNIRLLLPLSVLGSRRSFQRRKHLLLGPGQKAASASTLTNLCISLQKRWPFSGSSDLWYRVSGHFCTFSMLLQENEWNLHWTTW